MTSNPHINLARPRWDQLYYESLADSLAALTAVALAEAGPRNRPAQVLDIGCGRGELLQRLTQRGYAAVGTDLNPASARVSQQYAPVVLANFLEMGKVFRPASFDVVIASHVLEHVENPKYAVNVMKLLSRRWIVIAVPNLLRFVNWFVRGHRYVNPGHLQGWDSHHLKTLLEKNCGLAIQRWVQDSVTLPPLRRTALLNSAPLRLLENRLLPCAVPHLANSLIVLCESVETP